jgi:hypothetical protein
MGRPGNGTPYRQTAYALGLLLMLSGLALAAQTSGSSPAGSSTGNLVRAMKRMEAKLGFQHTGSFERESKKTAVAYRCYYTSKLDLPDDYTGLRVKRGSPRGCRLNTRKYDVFFYPLQAMAVPKERVTTSLAHSSPERLLMVIPHEDFHQDPALKGLPAPLAEAAATLVGFLTARDVAREQLGAGSEVYRDLARDPRLFLAKSTLTNRYFGKVRQLYADYRRNEISKEEALARKARLFGALGRDCETIEPLPKSFNRCLAANNNAGLAFDHTYTLYYPLMYAVAEAKSENLKATIDALRQAMAGQPAEKAIENLRSAGAGSHSESALATNVVCPKGLTKWTACHPERSEGSLHFLSAKYGDSSLCSE